MLKDICPQGFLFLESKAYSGRQKEIVTVWFFHFSLKKDDLQGESIS